VTAQIPAVLTPEARGKAKRHKRFQEARATTIRQSNLRRFF
jgi:hypothetical protein